MAACLRRFALFDVVGTALDDDDGVIHDDADGEHDGEQREQIDAEAERRHRREGADDGDRYGGRRHQHGAPVLDEHQDDDEHEDRRLEQRHIDLMDRGLDEQGGVEGNPVVESLGEISGKLRHLAGDFPGDIEGVGARQLEHRDARRLLRVEAKELAVGLGPEFGARHVAHAGDARVRSLLFGLHDDVAECLRVGETAGHVDGDLEILIPRGGRRPHLTRGDLLVLAVDGIHDVGRRQIARGELVGIEPHAHAVLPCPEDDDVTDTGQAAQARRAD